MTRKTDRPRPAWTRKRIVFTALGVTAACLVLAIGGFAVLVAVTLSGWNIKLAPKRQHLSPIPIDHEACPYVVATHNAAQNFVNADFDISLLPLETTGKTTTTVPFNKNQLDMEHALDDFEFNVIVATTHLPPEVQHYLATVRHDLDLGRVQLRAARDPRDLAERTNGLWSDGKVAYGLASDLVGTRCGVTLGV